MNPSNFSDTPNFKFLKSRQFKKNPGGLCCPARLGGMAGFEVDRT